MVQITPHTRALEIRAEDVGVDDFLQYIVDLDVHNHRLVDLRRVRDARPALEAVRCAHLTEIPDWVLRRLDRI